MISEDTLSYSQVREPKEIFTNKTEFSYLQSSENKIIEFDMKSLK